MKFANRVGLKYSQHFHTKETIRDEQDADKLDCGYPSAVSMYSKTFTWQP